MQSDLLQTTPAPARAAARKVVSAAPKRESAHAHVHRLEELRRTQNGFLVPPPPEEVFLQAGIDRVPTPSGSEVGAPNAHMTTIGDWWQATFNAGATAQDMWFVLTSWDKPRRDAKQFLRDKVWDSLYDQARRRDSERAAALEKERQPYGHLAHTRQVLRRAEEEERLYEEDLKTVKAEVALKRANVTRAEAAVAAFETEYGAIQ